ncbi:MAG: hypothetical protein HYR62_08935 [Actinobacteria bacterium]|nr:hypothetical protein [Actinomycetota bacterium]MBI3688567.1 hypothetical protein [Actinomycetota bacterium]
MIIPALLITITLGYLLVCWVRPFTPCKRCHGAGYRPSLLARHERLCRRCMGTGHQLRAGRRVLNYFRTLHDHGGHR